MIYNINFAKCEVCNQYACSCIKSPDFIAGYEDALNKIRYMGNTLEDIIRDLEWDLEVYVRRLK